MKRFINKLIDGMLLPFVLILSWILLAIESDDEKTFKKGWAQGSFAVAICWIISSNIHY